MTSSRIARVLTVGATLGAAYRLHEEPHNPGKFWHLVTCALAAYLAISTHHRGEPPRLNPHETSASYLAVPTALLAYRYETTATNAIWIAAVLAWAVCAYVSNQNEDS